MACALFKFFLGERFSLKANSKKKLGFVSYGGMARFPGRSSVCSLNCRADFFPRVGGFDSRGGGSFFLRGFFPFGFARGTARVLGEWDCGFGLIRFRACGVPVVGGFPLQMRSLCATIGPR